MELIYSIIFCVVGIIGGAIVTAINNKRKKLTRKIFTVNLISEKLSNINGLEIKYNSQLIRNLYSSTIQIKNTGNITINNVDIPKKRPLSIHTDGIFIIDKFNLQLPDPNNENDIHVTFDETGNGHSSTATIDFEFISPKQVITITLLHTGNISLGKWMIKDGKILESNEILDESDTQNHLFSKPLLSNILPFMIAMLLFLFITFPITIYLNQIKLEYQNTQNYAKNLEDIISSLEDQIYSMDALIENLISEIENLKHNNLENYKILP